MTARERNLLGWIWVAGMAALGFGILAAPEASARASELAQPGQGTALLLIAASILFAVVFPALATGGNRLISAASVLTAIFGYAGTTIILAGENPLLLAVVIVYTFYLVLMALALIPVFRLIRYIHAWLR